MDTPLKHPDAEACAQAIAAVIHDKEARSKVFTEFLAAHVNLKNWEGHAIGGRALALAKAKHDSVINEL